MNQPFPEVAKCSERSLFGMPFQCNAKQSDLEKAIAFNTTDPEGITNYSADTAFIMTRVSQVLLPHNTTPDRVSSETDNLTSIFSLQSSCLKFCKDYGLTPFLLTRKQLIEAFNKLNVTTKKIKSTTVTLPPSPKTSTYGNGGKDKKPANAGVKPVPDPRIIHTRAMYFGGANSG